MKKWLLVISITIFLALLIITYTTRDETISMFKLVQISIAVQYNESNSDLNNIYTPAFLGNIKEDEGFYRSTLRPFYITSTNIIERHSFSGSYIVNARVGDLKGEYYQVFHIIKKQGCSHYPNILKRE